MASNTVRNSSLLEGREECFRSASWKINALVLKAFQTLSTKGQRLIFRFKNQTIVNILENRGFGKTIHLALKVLKTLSAK
ncbi:MAG: hypothetical protein A2007_01230 [Verrucomicrobia bacterium GWC2_42_7]|nr:MAG: hypothetical protein A2007_01230 [Verrucomicrobia bacterium GWC2_42_7]